MLALNNAAQYMGNYKSTQVEAIASAREQNKKSRELS